MGTRICTLPHTRQLQTNSGFIEKGERGTSDLETPNVTPCSWSSSESLRPLASHPQSGLSVFHIAAEVRRRSVDPQPFPPIPLLLSGTWTPELNGEGGVTEGNSRYTAVEKSLPMLPREFSHAALLQIQRNTSALFQTAPKKRCFPHACFFTHTNTVLL